MALFSHRRAQNEYAVSQNPSRKPDLSCPMHNRPCVGHASSQNRCAVRFSAIQSLTILAAKRQICHGRALGARPHPSRFAPMVHQPCVPQAWVRDRQIARGVNGNTIRPTWAVGGKKLPNFRHTAIGHQGRPPNTIAACHRNPQDLLVR